MNPNTGLALLAGALLLVSAYYAWTIRKLLGTMQEMVSATKEMVEVTAKIFSQSVAPRVECRTAILDGHDTQAPDAPAGQLIAETTITNLGAHQVRLARVRLETDPQGEQVRRFVARWLVTDEREVVRMPFGPGTLTKVFVDLEDMAGQRHIVVAEPVAAPPRNPTQVAG